MAFSQETDQLMRRVHEERCTEGTWAPRLYLTTLIVSSEENVGYTARLASSLSLQDDSRP